MVFWRSRALVDEDTAAWHLENFAWLMGEFGRDGDFDATELVLPKPGFFPTNGETGHALAVHLFNAVKGYCNMSAWPVLLVADGSPATSSGGETVAVHTESRTLGRFVADEAGVMITYDPALLKSPQDLISTFAHELAHYLIATANTPPICTADEHEFLTDLCAVFLGFGVFLANGRFCQTVTSIGWGHGSAWHRSGYLPEADLLFATAIFLAVKGIDPDEASSCLKPHMRKDLHKTVASLRGSTAIAELRQIAASSTSASHPGPDEQSS